MVHPDEKPNCRAAASLSRRQSRLIDRLAIEDFGIPGMVLMENAGRGCFEQLQREGCQGPVVILCGSGNNGGDGFVIARHLMAYHVEVKILLVGDRLSCRGDAAKNLGIVDRLGVPVASAEDFPAALELESAIAQVGGVPTEWIVDAVSGTGARGPMRRLAADVIRVSNGIWARKMAVDLPSGMDCDSGQVTDPTFQAEMTCTMVAAKRGFSNPNALAWLGEVRVIDIGVDSELLLSELNRIA